MKIYINQVQFNSCLIRLFEKLNPKSDKFDTVVGILNGGYNVSKPIANFFNKVHSSVHISYYDGEQMLFEPYVREDKLDIFRSLWNLKTPFLLVDDIVDTGRTIRWFADNTNLKKGKDFWVASIHWCRESSPDLCPEFFVDIKRNGDWIVYPWEMENV